MDWTGRMAEVLDEVPQEEREGLDALMHDGVTAEILADVLTRNGYPISASTIRTQRRALRRREIGATHG